MHFTKAHLPAYGMGVKDPRRPYVTGGLGSGVPIFITCIGNRRYPLRGIWRDPLTGERYAIYNERALTPQGLMREVTAYLQRQKLSGQRTPNTDGDPILGFSTERQLGLYDFAGQIPSSWGFTAVPTLAQTLTEEGYLTRIRINLWKAGNPTDNTYVDVLEYSGSGDPDLGVVLATATVPGSSIPNSEGTYIEYSFDEPVELTTAQQAIIWRRDTADDANYYTLYRGGFVNYAGGNAWLEINGTWTEASGNDFSETEFYFVDLEDTGQTGGIYRDPGRTKTTVLTGARTPGSGSRSPSTGLSREVVEKDVDC